MPTITVKNIPDNVYEKLKKAAEADRRSINGEVIYCIERAVVSSVISPEERLSIARALRSKTARHPVTDKAFSKAKMSGRR